MEGGKNIKHPYSTNLYVFIALHKYNASLRFEIID